MGDSALVISGKMSNFRRGRQPSLPASLVAVDKKTQVLFIHKCLLQMMLEYSEFSVNWPIHWLTCRGITWYSRSGSWQAVARLETSCFSSRAIVRATRREVSSANRGLNSLTNQCNQPTYGCLSRGALPGWNLFQPGSFLRARASCRVTILSCRPLTKSSCCRPTRRRYCRS